MQFEPEVFPFLRGERFDDKFSLQLNRIENRNGDKIPLDRIALLERLVTGKRVVHVGCVDHSPAIIEREMSRETWLHGGLLRVAGECIGVDINEAGIDYMKTALAIRDLYCCDLTRQDLPVVSGLPLDFLLLGEILEHIENPVSFLHSLRKRHFPHAVQRLLVTVPNAFRLDNYRLAKAGCEKINSDHCYWFTPFTLAKVLTRADFQLEGIHFVVHKKKAASGLRKRWRHHLKKRFPLLRDTIVAVAVPVGSEAIDQLESTPLID